MALARAVSSARIASLRRESARRSQRSIAANSARRSNETGISWFELSAVSNDLDGAGSLQAKRSCRARRMRTRSIWATATQCACSTISGVAPSPANSRASLSALQRKVPDAQGSVNSTHGEAHSEPRAFFPALFWDRYLPLALARFASILHTLVMPHFFRRCREVFLV